MKNIALLVAAGNSTRFEADTPKQYIEVNGKTILRWTIDKFLENRFIDNIIVVINKEHQTLYKNSTKDINILNPVFGEKTRKESVFLGLKALEELKPEKVLIHDAVRPLVSTDLINEVIKKLDNYEAVDVALPITDTVKYQNGNVLEIINRDKVYITQTPQGFRFKTILELHKRIQEDCTDDIALCLKKNISICKISGKKNNIKITNCDDLKYFNFMMQENRIYRTGLGIDVHRFSEPLEKDTMIKICGIEVPHNQSIIAHSDGDVGFHAITEALLGAMALGNIGQLFPPSDDKYKNIDSEYFLRYTLNKLRKLNANISNIDVTIICERPKIMPYSKQMRANIARVLAINITQVSVKATTTEKMGFLGMKEGIAAQAVSTIVL